MNTFFKTLRYNRAEMTKLLENLSADQLNYIPEGFNNSIIWNIGHMMVTQQLLFYALSGIPVNVDQIYIDKYRKGTRPTPHYASAEEITYIKDQLTPLIEQTEKDFDSGIFKTYEEYPTSSGITLLNIEDALIYNTFHEGIHHGVVLSLKKCI